MLFWVEIAVLTFAVAAAFLVPLTRAQQRGERETRDGAMAVYRDQLQELDRDRAGGLISSEQVDYARAEIARRLLAADKGDETGQAVKPPRKASGNGLAQAFVVLLVPAVGLGLYLALGSPGLPSQPLQARLENPGNDMSLLIAQAERHLMQKPEDGAGWDVLAPIYLQQNRMGEAELAFRNAIRLKGASPERLNGLGEALIAQSDGVVTDAARDLFSQSVALNRDNPRGAYYLALALEQSGKREEALAAFKAIAAQSPPNAPWQPLVARHITRNDPQAAATAAPLGNPDAAAVAAAQGLPDSDRQAMIKGMVESLDAKLKADPNNFEGWVRLMRSYVVLKDNHRALEALKTGLKTFPAEGEQGKQLIAMAQQLGLPVEEALK
ncbi:c-type cytochrome biogenesis protein CcmI [Agrobacterium vitis]|uniref:C-type cytochrome biogenesis protein CcmI n=1 Tax=Agrobacterium vitis TaxID=373 RepID=A0A368NSF6_AGRVI|nr:c-type cytochrome biogenesis protein CcmI [Agrobacterium vitis]KAA3519628.1 c-type cytochrome biogenesis protein CcmI [Agrobacterium vitis]KAA3532160.1 c-type cytochrome biogenesis protein CcmI [Agrobacterium vitis]MCF1475770.1 c-type cytochrome biogenesis protein CcmI [Agrobacterium vitis]MUZ94995.1 c-type cytochrome biogenesis protein CcmI [Agrobacterium vitis]MVA29462.1 c-type cytochrome biogenesis protein CcmI [Agrobacterium vitis]